MNKIVSIIIPAYNAENILNKCLESIIKQTYSNLEIIVVNDGSKDNTINIIENFKQQDNRIKLINQENKGVSEARNKGIENSSGDYILFVDADDWLQEDMIEKMVNYIDSMNVDVVRCNYYGDGINGTVIGELYELANQKISKEDFIKKRVYEHSLLGKEPIKNLVMLLLIKKKVFDDELKFDSKLFMMEDVVFYKKLFDKIDSIYFLNEPLYHYCENINSVTHDSTKYKKNIYGIIDVNEVLRKETKDIVDENKLNTNNLRVMICYISYIFEELGKKELEKILDELYSNEKFNYILNHLDCSDAPLYKKLIINAIKKHNILLLLILFEVKKILKK